MRRTIWSLAKRYDVCVIGGGPAGIAAALRACDFKKSACIIEPSRIGGADFWNGALQSKTLWEMAKFSKVTQGKTAHRFLKSTRPLPPIEHSRIMDSINKAATMREAEVLHQLSLSCVDLLKGKGSFKTPNTVEVTKEDGSTDTVEADYFIIATGAEPRPHPTAIADGKVVFTSDDIMLHPFPKSIVIIGAGVIGCEFASIFANFDQTKVNVIEKTNRILPMEDEDISLFVQHLLQEKGVNFHHHSQMTKNRVEDGKFYYTLKDLRNGKEEEHVVDSTLVSIGRIPNVKPLNLEAIGVKLDQGRISRDDHNRVAPFKHIYACGDVATRVALVNVGEVEARSCIEHIYTPYPEDQLKVKLDNLSTIMFLDQEVAAVGLNEQQCKKEQYCLQNGALRLRVCQPRAFNGQHQRLCENPCHK
ncbi:dihydrolipoamide dehydrogenase [Strigomonas culicis]|uniref:Dihydrolipoamide dehydrogenase n=1 Tax=Strigomonas culicis TaxID=28005 RepID=S9TMI3_9TRYP|nr:dihydrolipoamide dehydrogenase [Strigomonas culicis]|eukprot:EPY19462.1 dihydrolipoamide dehydrogenase [Strigomonas culicis]